MYTALVIIHIINPSNYPQQMPADQLVTLTLGPNVEACNTMGEAFASGVSTLFPGANVTMFCVQSEGEIARYRGLTPHKQWMGNPNYVPDGPMLPPK